MRRSVLSAGLLPVLAAATLVTPALAQDATPTEGFVTPDPAECRIEPRPAADIERFVVDPAATPAVIDQGSPTPFAAPDGEPADPETAAEFAATVADVFACWNAGDPLRAFAHFTDDFLRDSFEGIGLTAEDAAFLTADPAPVPPEARESIRVRDVRLLPDGRIGAFVDIRTAEGTSTEYGIAVREGDRLLIDSVVEVASPAATPTP